MNPLNSLVEEAQPRLERRDHGDASMHGANDLPARLGLKPVRELRQAARAIGQNSMRAATNGGVPIQPKLAIFFDGSAGGKTIYRDNDVWNGIIKYPLHQNFFFAAHQKWLETGFTHVDGRIRLVMLWA
jgi:hypothetical protein